MAERLIPTLRAFAWLRWRFFMASMRRSMKGGLWKRFAGWAQPLSRILVALCFGPALLVLTIGGFTLGWVLGSGRLPVENVQQLLRIMTLFFLVGAPIMALAFSAKSVLPGMSRFLLLPVSRRSLFLMFYLGGLGEIGLLMGALPLLAFPLGLAVGGITIGGAWGTAAIALITGVALIAMMNALQALALTLSANILRDRRRSQTFALLTVLAATGLGFIPLLIEETDVKLRLSEAFWFVNLPGELYTRAVMDTFAGKAVPAIAAMIVTALLNVFLFRLGERSYVSLMKSTASGGERGRKIQEKQRPNPLASFMPKGALGHVLAVGEVDFRTISRTASGKLVLIQPVFLTLVLGLVYSQLDDFLKSVPLLDLPRDVIGVILISTLASMATLELHFNQFAVNRAGLTQFVLSPLSPLAVLNGKVLAITALSVAGALPAVLLVVGFLRPGIGAALADFLLVVLVIVSAKLMVSPVAALASAFLPRPVNLDNPLVKGQPHGLAVILGMVAGMVAAGLPALVLLSGMLAFDNRGLAAVLVLLWCLAMALLARILMPPLADVFKNRREALLLSLREG